MLQDFRLCLRLLAKSPGFTAMVVLTLALGIGANTAIFSVVNGVLLNPLPFPRPDRLVAVYATTPGIARGPITYLNFLDWQRDSRTLSSMALYRGQDYSFTGSGYAERLSGSMISADFFRTLGVAPVVGRDFRAADDRIGAAPVAILGGGLWKRRFASSPDIVGRTMDLNGVLYTVVGVMPASFGFYGQSKDVYTPIGRWNDPNFRDRRIDVSAHGIGRLAPGVTLAQANAEMDGIARHLAAEFPVADKNVGITLVSMQEDLVGGVRPFLWLLLGAVGFVLLISCGNVANLLLARASGRTGEFAVRAALGAGRARILRQLFTESVILAGLGGGLGLLLVFAVRPAILRLLPAGLPGVAQAAVDGRVLAFTLAASLLAGLVFGCAPALALAGSDARTMLNGAVSGRHSGQSGLQGWFVSAEVAMALVLLVGAGLMLRSLAALLAVNPGYQPDHAVTFDLSLPATPATTAADTRARLRAFDAAIHKLPGVVAASVTLGSRPLIHDSSLPFWIEGRPKPADTNAMPQALFYLAEGGYARAMGLKLERGRFIDDSDNEHAPVVIDIDDHFARTWFPHQDPIGQHVNIGFFDVQARIIGVVGHVRQWGLAPDPQHAIDAQFYYPFMQLPEKIMPLAADTVAVVVRTAGDPDAIIAPVRQAVHAVDSREIVFESESLDALLAASLATRRAALTLLVVFGMLALALSTIGIYGVISCRVARRRREIGVRIALGGRHGHVLRLVLGDALRMSLLGVAAGWLASLALTRLMRGMLYGVSASDPMTYVATAYLLVAVALLAAYLPARRAAATDPAIVLRCD